jgi:hypothetical protein
MLEGMAKTQWNVAAVSVDHFIIATTPATVGGRYNISLGNCC